MELKKYVEILRYYSHVSCDYRDTPDKPILTPFHCSANILMENPEMYIRKCFTGC